MSGILALMIGVPILLIFLAFIFFTLIFTLGFYAIRFFAAKARRMANLQENMQYQGRQVIDMNERKNRNFMLILGLIVAAVFFILLNFLVLDTDGSIHWKNNKQEIREGQYV